MSDTLVLASGNAGKIREMNALLEPLGFRVRSQSEFDVIPVEETGLSFLENALLKARHAAKVSGLAALADDSGICVDALNGAPGIHSARYSGADATDASNNAKLLAALADVPAARRSARYHCVLVYCRHAEDPVPLVCEASWAGHIGTQSVGAGGFGYDPLFIPAGGRQTAAQLDPGEKNRISHRGQAMQLLLARLRSD